MNIAENWYWKYWFLARENRIQCQIFKIIKLKWAEMQRFQTKIIFNKFYNDLSPISKIGACHTIQDGGINVGSPCYSGTTDVHGRKLFRNFPTLFTESTQRSHLFLMAKQHAPKTLQKKSVYWTLMILCRFRM